MIKYLIKREGKIHHPETKKEQTREEIVAETKRVDFYSVILLLAVAVLCCAVICAIVYVCI